MKLKDLEVLHDKHPSAFKCVGNFAVIWVDHFRVTEDDEGNEIKRKFLRSSRHEIPVGETFMDKTVTQIDPEWVKKEKEILSGFSLT